MLSSETTTKKSICKFVSQITNHGILYSYIQKYIFRISGIIEYEDTLLFTSFSFLLKDNQKQNFERYIKNLNFKNSKI